MDAQFPFASRDELWNIIEQLKDIRIAHYQQSERIARLERRKDDDARLKNVWGPLSPFPPSAAGSIPPGMLDVQPTFDRT